MRTINASSLLDGARFNSFHARILFWCALIIICDGYDLVIYGVVLPSLMETWGLTAWQAGMLGSSALVGMMFGALFFGSLSDRIGRRKVITLCVIMLSGFTALNGLARTPEEFAIYRFLAGLGIGGVMPNVVALMNEYAPKKMRSTLVALVFCGYFMGGMLSAGLGMLLIPSWGWPSVFFVAGVPLLLLPLLISQLPESINFLIRKGKIEQAQALLAKASPDYKPSASDELTLSQGHAGKATISQLFQNGRALSTLMLWTAFFCSLLMVYALSAWLPKLMQSAGYDLSYGLSFLLVINFGAIVGTIGGGWLGDRIGINKVLLGFFVLGTLSLCLLALKTPLMLLYLLVAIAGAGIFATQVLANACTAQFYPAHISSTGVGWALGIGRLGAISGPLLGGALQATQLPVHVSFLAFAVTGAVGALAILLFILSQPRQAKTNLVGRPSQAKPVSG